MILAQVNTTIFARNNFNKSLVHYTQLLLLYSKIAKSLHTYISYITCQNL